ncbi:MAG: DNA-directed RNA polymerase subunit alpha C-terminal domain-containing protein [Patescibacteria group bacterium]
MDTEKVKDAKRFYNTNIVYETKRELINLGYVSTYKLPAQLDKEKLIEEAKISFNTVALYVGGYITPFVKQSFLNFFILKNLKRQPTIEIIIKAEGDDFIDKLLKFLSAHQKVNFEIIPMSGLRTSISETDKINFLSLRLGDAGLGVRNENILKSQDVEYIFEICDYSINDFYKFRNFGNKSLVELRQCFAAHGLVFGEVPQDLIDKARGLRIKKLQR